MKKASALTPEITEPSSSKKTGSVKQVLKSGHLPSKMQYHKDLTQLGRQITQIILTSPEPETVLPKIAGVLGEIFQVDACLIVAGNLGRMKDKATPPSLQTAHWCNNSGISPQISSSLWEHPALAALQTNSSPLAICNLQESHVLQPLEWFWEGLSVKAILGIQTCFQSSINGAIFLGRIQPYEWTDGEKEQFKALSDEVAIAISQVQLQQQVRTAAQYQALIEQVASVLRSASDLEQILQVVTQATAQTLAIDCGLILLLKYANPILGKRKAGASNQQNEESIHSSSNNISIFQQHLPKAKLEIVSEWSSTMQPTQNSSSEKRKGKNQKQSSPSINASSTQPSQILNHSFKLSECTLCQQAFTNAPEPLAIANRKDLPPIALNSGIAQLFKQDAWSAILMIPLESQNTVLGFLVLVHRQPRSWQPEELELVKCVSAQASTAIIQSQTLRQVQALVEERTGQLQRSLEVQAKLYEQTRRQVDQLRQLNLLKDEFLSTVNHELRTPLTTMKMAIELLYKPELPPQVRGTYMDILKQQCTNEINLIDDLLALQKLESHKQPIHLQKIDLKRLILDLAASFEQPWIDKGLTLEVNLPKRYTAVADASLSSGAGEVTEGGRSLMLQSDYDSLNRILLELLTNAGKYSDPDTVVCLRVEQQVESQIDQIVVTLTNIGPGISSTDITYIFDKFRRGQGVTQNAVQGTGLGLALVKSLVQHINGTIDVSSNPIENTHSYETRFTLTLPQFFDSTKV